MSKVLARSSAWPSHSPATMRCPVDETGMNSVTPSTSPRTDRLQRAQLRTASSPDHLRVERLVHAARSGRPRTRGPWRWRPRACAACRAGSRSSSTARRPIASTEPTGSRMPFTPSSTTSGSPPARLATTGDAARHRFQRGQAERLGLRRAGRRGRSPGAAWPPSRAGRGTARPRATPSSRASFSASGRSGPSPIMTSVAGMARRTRAKTRTTSFTRFTSRKLETWVIHLVPVGREAVPLPRGAPGRYSARFTKLGITLRSQLTQPNARYVSSRRYGETAVTASELLDRELGDGVEARLLAHQRDVGAVQGGDHLECGARPRSISRARQAVVAWGIA